MGGSFTGRRQTRDDEWNRLGETMAQRTPKLFGAFIAEFRRLGFLQPSETSANAWRRVGEQLPSESRTKFVQAISVVMRRPS